MADRGMTAAVLTEIAESQNKPFHLVDIQFTTGTVYFTDSNRDIDWNYRTYTAAGDFLTFSDITEQNAMTVGEIEVQLSGVDRAYLSTILNETFMDRILIIRKGFLNDSNAIIVNPIIIYQGRMDQPNIIESSNDCVISVTVANQFVDFIKTTGRYTNTDSQALFFPNDRGFQYAHQVIKEINWGRVGTSGGGGGVPPSIPPGFPGGPGVVIPDYPIPLIPSWVDEVYGGGLGVIAGDTVLVVNQFNHNLSTGDTATIVDALAVGELPENSINKSHTVTVVDAQKFTVPITETITTTVSHGGGNGYTINEQIPTTPFIKTQTTANNEHIVTITQPGNLLSAGKMVEIQNAEAVGGIPADNLNTIHYVKSVSDNSFDIEVKKFEKVTAPPIKTTSGSTTVQVEIANNTKNVGDTVVIAGAVDTGGIVAANINGTQTITAITENTVSFTSSGTASSTAKGGGNSVTIDAATPVTPPLETTASSTTVTLHEGNHGLAVGDTFTLFNTMPVASLDPSELNKEHTVVSVPNTDSVTFTTTTAAASTSIGGGSNSVVFLPVKATSAELGGGELSKLGVPSVLQ